VRSRSAGECPCVGLQLPAGLRAERCSGWAEPVGPEKVGLAPVPGVTGSANCVDALQAGVVVELDKWSGFFKKLDIAYEELGFESS